MSGATVGAADGGNDAAVATATVRVSVPRGRLPMTGGSTYRILFSATTLAVFGAVLVLFGRRRESGSRGA